MWKTVEACVRGTSHIASGKPCQDAVSVRRMDSPMGPAMVVAIADGAGSATHAAIAARSIVEYLAASAVARSADLGVLTRDRVLSWFEDARRHLEATVAVVADCNISSLACTAMLAIAWRDGGVFAQVGDGAWVVQTAGGLSAATWPVTGEYANQTKFITSPDTGEHFAFRDYREPMLAIAGFTDGVQSMALNLTARTVHQPFFDRLLDPLRNAAMSESLDATMAAFLDSPPVNSRTDDDKTLVLACWQEPGQSTNDPAR